MAGVPVILAVAVVGLLVAGCAGAGKPETVSSSGPATSAPLPNPTVETGSVAGSILDEEQNPLGGARAAIVELSVEAKADESGAFVFNDVPPGTYRVAVEKLGFESASRTVDVVAGQVVETAFILKAVPLAEDLVPKMIPFQGLIQCSANWLYPANLCGGVTGEEKNMFVFEPDKTLKLKEAVFELAWKPSIGGTSGELELNVCEDIPDRTQGMVCLESDYNEYKEGPSPVVIRLEDLPVKTYPKFATGAGAAFLGVSYQQSFWIYVTLCYNEVCPDEYTAVPPP